MEYNDAVDGLLLEPKRLCFVPIAYSLEILWISNSGCTASSVFLWLLVDALIGSDASYDLINVYYTVMMWFIIPATARGSGLDCVSHHCFMLRICIHFHLTRLHLYFILRYGILLFLRCHSTSSDSASSPSTKIIKPNAGFWWIQTSFNALDSSGAKCKYLGSSVYIW